MALADRSPLLRLWRQLNVAGAWDWWWRGLVAAVPVPLRWLLVEPPRALVALKAPRGWRLTREGLRVRLLVEGELSVPKVQRVLRQRLPKVLCVVAEQALVRTLVLPLAAESKLYQVVGFDLDRLTPFKAHQLYFHAHVIQRDRKAKLLRVRLVAVPKRVVDEQLAALAPLGFVPQAVTVEGEPATVNLLPAKPKGMGFHGVVTALMALVAVGAIGAALFLPLWQLRSVAIWLIPPVEQARAQAESVIQLRSTLESAQEAAQFLSQERRQRPFAIDIVRALTQILPDDAFLEALDVRAGEVQLQGATRQASRLLPLLEASPLFREVTFGASTTQNPDGSERFQILLKLETTP